MLSYPQMRKSIGKAFGWTFLAAAAAGVFSAVAFLVGAAKTAGAIAAF
jgi:hypothetical protein